MMYLDLNKLAESMRYAHATGTPIRLPAMRMHQIARLTRLMRQLDSTASILVN